MSGSNVVQLRRKPRADVVEQAILSGRKLPLQIMLDHMWQLADETQRLESSNNTDDQLISRVARERLFHIAAACAPFIHPKVAATIVSGDPDNPIRVTHEDRFARLTDESAYRFLKAIKAGELTIEDVDAELTD